jgi:hypothetical protein
MVSRAAARLNLRTKLAQLGAMPFDPQAGAILLSLPKYVMPRMGAKGRCAAIIRELELPVPLDLGQFVAGLERQTARPIRLRPSSSEPGCPCSLWIGTTGTGYIHRQAGPPLPRHPHRPA